MARLKPTERAGLPDRAFAYVDSKGRRRLPIHDAAHVRNALARFRQVGFESDAARERARKRLLQAASDIPGLESLPLPTQQAIRAFQRDLPQLLRDRKPGQKAAAYHGGRFLGLGASMTELFQRCRAEGIPEHEVFVHALVPIVTRARAAGS